MAAFFDPRALSAWWDVESVVATPRPLGPYAIEWRPTEARDELLGLLGGVFHGTVVDYQRGEGFFVADVYWLPPEGDPIGPMAFEVHCSADADTAGGRQATILRVTQRGVDDSPRWIRFYELIGAVWPGALARLKDYLEHGQGVWDLRSY